MSDSNFSKLCEWKKVHEVVDEAWAEDCLSDDEVELPALLEAPEITGYRAKLPEFCEGCLHAPTCGGGCGAAAQWMLGLRDDKRLPDPVLWQHVDDDFERRLERERQAGGRRRLEVVG